MHSVRQFYSAIESINETGAILDNIFKEQVQYDQSWDGDMGGSKVLLLLSGSNEIAAAWYEKRFLINWEAEGVLCKEVWIQ